MDCGVCVGGFDGHSEFFKVVIRQARKGYECCECGEPILKGQRYEYVSGKCEGDLWSERTCLICAEIATAFCCEGRCVGHFWEDFEDCWEAVTTACFNKLQTVEAKTELRRRWMDWKELQIA